MLIPITEQTWVPEHRIERISVFGTTASIKYVDQREVERVEAQDAQRLMMFLHSRTETKNPDQLEAAKAAGKARR